eukprot:4811274-Pyramimonas_sp.AAC.2
MSRRQARTHPRSSAHAVAIPLWTVLKKSLVPTSGGSKINAQMVPLRGHPCATPLEAKRSGRRVPPISSRAIGTW